ncbi:concanavalin A-like lectin/glucanase domain-containing protein [Xylariaceae sp. FL0804]|nr:concanavalin A-like lectin/glucanase domain-containing protein [Xylariaceae sp. FL0804]
MSMAPPLLLVGEPLGILVALSLSRSVAHSLARSLARQSSSLHASSRETMRSQALLFALPLAPSALAGAAAIQQPTRVRRQDVTATLIPTDSFSDFDAYWSPLYPWGDSHNGGALMNESQISTSDGVLTLTATPVSGEPDVESGGEEIAIDYLSGTVYAQQTFTVETGGGFDFSGEFMATTTYGTWPAFWLTAVSGWPPEIDMAEWKGDGDISFNTFNTSSEVATDDVAYDDPDDWHTVLCEIRDVDGSTVSATFYLDGVEQTTQYGSDYVGAALYLIIDLQMEGSSGSPGPDYGKPCRFSTFRPDP